MGCFVPGGQLCSVDGFKHFASHGNDSRASCVSLRIICSTCRPAYPDISLSSNRADLVRQEHFLKEIEAIRRRLLALEDNKAESKTIGVTPDTITPVQFRSIAVEESAAKAEEVSGS